jgi:hypothetical protein
MFSFFLADSLLYKKIIVERLLRLRGPYHCIPITDYSLHAMYSLQYVEMSPNLLILKKFIHVCYLI